MERYPYRNYNKKHRKTIILVIIVIVSIALVLAYKSGYINLPNINQGLTDNYCEENIIPENLTFFGEQFVSGVDEEALKSGVIYLIPPVWKDRTKIGESNGELSTNPYNCRMGEKQGENINYFYCDGNTYSKEFRNIDKDGNVLNIELKNYKINFVVDKSTPLEKRTVYKTTMYKSQQEAGELISYPVVDYKCTRLKN